MRSASTDSRPRIRSVARRQYRVGGPTRRRRRGRPHAYYLAIGFPPAANSAAYRMRETANQLYAHGWDVTVVTGRRESWEPDFGLDHTLSEAVDRAIRIVELPLERYDLETDVRRFSRSRSIDPARWDRQMLERDLEIFPEPRFGVWRPQLEEALLWLHDRDPADLLVTSCAPYVIDFRDGWSIDVIAGGEAFPPYSVAGRWESTALGNATAIWCVNEPIAQHYRDRYPALADRIEVVRNGFDADSVPTGMRRPDPAAGLTFGYLGSVNFKADFLATVLDAWREARRRDPLVARSRFEVRGYIGAGPDRDDTAHSELLSAAATDGVVVAGPVPKSKVAEVYDGWDVLVLMLVGGRFVTSGKVYEVLATGRPVVSAHDIDHDASTVLAGSPMWTGAVGLDVDRLADSFSRGARLAVEATPEQHAAARAMGCRYKRDAQVEPAVRRLTVALRKQPRPALPITVSA